MTRAAENLCLHYVCGALTEGTSPRRMTVSRDALRSLVRSRLEAGRTCASLADYLAEPPSEDRFTLSFDDAHASLLAHALPVLGELSVTATVFVPTAYVGTSGEWLDWDGLRRLRDAGWALASHTHTHPRMSWRLYDEDDAAHAARLEDELARSLDAMERELGERPRLFAYPYGEAPDAARRVVLDAGIAAAFTVSEDREHDGDLLRIPRLDACASPATSETPTGFTVVVPACDRAPILRDVVDRLARQSYPTDRYEVIVVDDGSTEDLGALFHDPPPHVSLVRQGDRSFRAGQARQRGVREGKHDHLVFLDADVAVDPDFLWHLDWVHRRERDAVLLGYLSGYNLHDLGHLHTPADVIGNDVTRLARIPDRAREPTLRACLDNLDWLDAPWPLTYTGNLSLPRALLERAGGFADEFVGWGLEDIDLGVRLHRAGGRFVFSRFAVGVHVVDPSEPGSRNPFRAPAPTVERFAGYLDNLAKLAARHPGDAAVQAYVERSRADIAETCGRPHTVGIEVGGAARVRPPHHALLHHVQPGGVPEHELLDRVAYADKVGARSIFILGGAPAEHPAFHRVLAASRAVVSWVSMQTLAYPFARPGAATAARDAGLCGAVALVCAMDAATHEALHGRGTYADFVAGLDALTDAGLEVTARVVVTERTLGALELTLCELASRGVRVEEAVAVDLVGGAPSALAHVPTRLVTSKPVSSAPLSSRDRARHNGVG